MNLIDQLLKSDKAVSVKNILKEEANVMLLRINSNEILKEHMSKTNALLILLEGAITYHEADKSITLSSTYDFLHIPKQTTHKVVSSKDALLLLIQ